MNDASTNGASPRRATLAVLVAVALVLVAGLAALGTWQVQRMGWKRELIARVDARVHADPVAAPNRADWPSLSPEADTYRRVRATGVFLDESETLVQAVTEHGGGFWVMTPLHLADGSIVLINRGFVPAARSDAASRAAGQITGRTTVTGLLRVTEAGGGFLRSNDPGENRWYSRDVAAIAAARGLSDVAPYFIDAETAPNAGGLPVGGLTVVAFHDNHIVYAITWYALAVMVGGAAIYLIRDARQSPRLPAS